MDERELVETIRRNNAEIQRLQCEIKRAQAILRNLAEEDSHDLGTGYEPDDPKGWVVSGDYPDFDSMRKAMKENG